MAKILGIASGKGGVGKTTTAINLGLVLNNLGRRVVVVDGDILKPNIGTMMGVSMEEVKNHTLHHAIKTKKQLDGIVYVHSSGLKFIPGDVSETAQIKLEKPALEGMKSSELVILDTPPGYGEDVEGAIKACDSLIIVVTPEATAVQDGLKTLRLAEKLNVGVMGFVLNRYKPASPISEKDVEKLTGKKVLAVINESSGFDEAIKHKHPEAYFHPDSKPTSGYRRLAALLLGQKYAEAVETSETPFMRLLKRLGLK
jgi:septum site-determining protein MinD